MPHNLIAVLGYYVAATTILLVVVALVTIVLLRKDKFFALALTFAEIAGFVAVSTFGQGPLAKIALAIGEFEAEISATSGTEPPYWAALAVIFLSGLFVIGVMGLRTWDKQIPRNPSA